MSDRSDKLAIQKKLIRCVALTDKDGFTMTTFVKAYKQFENKECPFREMGYQSFEQFLRSMPDVIEFREVDGKEIIFGIPDQYTEHVTKMIAQQKTEDIYRPKKIIPSNNFSSRPKEYQKMKMVPREVQSTVEQLMKENPEGIPLEDFGNAYKKRFKVSILTNSGGFTDVDDLVEAMPRLVYVREDTKGIKKVIPTLARMEEWKKNRTLRDEWEEGRPVIPAMTRHNLKELISKYPDGLRMDLLNDKYKQKFKEEIRFRLFGCQSVLEMCLLLTDIFKIPKKKSVTSPHMLFPIILTPMPSLKEQMKQIIAEEVLNVKLPTDIADKIQILLSRHNTKGLDVKCFSQGFKALYGKPLDITKLGFGTVERMLESMGDIVVYKTVQKQYIDHENRIASRDVKLVRLKPEELEKAVEKEKQAALRLSRSWPILWTNLSPGISEEDISYLFRVFGTVLEITVRRNQANATIYMESEEDMETAFVGINDHTLDGQKVHLEMLRSSKPPTSPEKEKETKTSPPPKEETKINRQSSTPKNYIPMQKLPQEAISKDFFEVYIGELINPDLFYIQLKDRARDFNSEIIEEMDAFYNDTEGKSDYYEWPIEGPHVDKYCAALYQGEWHRAIITRYDEKHDLFTVNYIDYGTVGTIRRFMVRVLDEQFTKFPVQAIRARLSQIVPMFYKKKWSNEALELFKQLVLDVGNDGLLARITGVNVDKKCISVCLYDMVTNDELNGINFNCALIKKGLAIAQEDEGYLQEPYELLTDEFFPTTSSCMDSFQVNISNDDELEAHNKVVKKDFERPSDKATKKPRRSSDQDSNDIANLADFDGTKEELAAFSPIMKPSEDALAINVPRTDVKRPVALKGAIEPRITTHYLPSNLHSDYIVHIIKHEDEKFVTSCEISLMIPKFKGKDVVSKLLQLKKALIQCRRIERSENENLFEECIIEDVKGVELSSGSIAKSLSLYKLHTVPKILKLFSDPVDPILLQELEKLCAGAGVDM